MLTSLGVAGLLGIIGTGFWVFVLWRWVLELGWGWLPEIRV